MLNQRTCINCRFLHLKRTNKQGDSFCTANYTYVKNSDFCPEHKFHFNYLNTNPTKGAMCVGKTLDKRGD